MSPFQSSAAIIADRVGEAPDVPAVASAPTTLLQVVEILEADPRLVQAIAAGVVAALAVYVRSDPAGARSLRG